MGVRYALCAFDFESGVCSGETIDTDSDAAGEELTGDFDDFVSIIQSHRMEIDRRHGIRQRSL